MFAVERSLSRIMEMQTEEYWEKWGKQINQYTLYLNKQINEHTHFVICLSKRATSHDTKTVWAHISQTHYIVVIQLRTMIIILIAHVKLVKWIAKKLNKHVQCSSLLESRVLCMYYIFTYINEYSCELIQIIVQITDTVVFIKLTATSIK